MQKVKGDGDSTVCNKLTFFCFFFCFAETWPLPQGVVGELAHWPGTTHALKSLLQLLSQLNAQHNDKTRELRGAC